MSTRRFLAVLLAAAGVLAAFAGGYVASGSTDTATTAALRAFKTQPASTTVAHVKTSFVFGRTAFAEPASATSGVPTIAYSIAHCPRGQHVLSGGWSSSDTSPDPVTISSSVATNGLNGWLVGAKDTSQDNSAPGYDFATFAVCSR